MASFAIKARMKRMQAVIYAPVEARTEQQARRLFKEKHGDCAILSVTRGAPPLKGYGQLAKWLKENNVTAQEAKQAVQVMVINERNIEPWPCPKCAYDLMNGTDHVGDAYLCPNCHNIIQTG